MERYVKQEDFSKYEYLMELGNGYESPTKKDIESNRKEGDETGKPQGNEIRQNTESTDFER